MVNTVCPEITQELAAETHQSLEQALPHLESSIDAINSIDKGEIAELRGIKTVPELVLNVLEAVCILLGVKPDWPTAKNLISEPTFMQQLVEFDKDNVTSNKGNNKRKLSGRKHSVNKKNKKASKGGSTDVLAQESVFDPD